MTLALLRASQRAQGFRCELVVFMGLLFRIPFFQPWPSTQARARVCVCVCVCKQALFVRGFTSCYKHITSTFLFFSFKQQGAGAWIAGLPLTKTPAFHGDVFWDARTCTCSLSHSVTSSRYIGYYCQWLLWTCIKSGPNLSREPHSECLRMFFSQCLRL